MMFLGSRVKIWAGPKSDKQTGPMIIYWYATGGSVAEVNQGIPQQSITEITGAGGIIAAMYSTTSKGMNTGDNVWYTGDFDVTDQIIACAAKIHNIDTHHIHALGWSAGGLQSGYHYCSQSRVAGFSCAMGSAGRRASDGILSVFRGRATLRTGSSRAERRP
jgi:hypothetical protein